MVMIGEGRKGKRHTQSSSPAKLVTVKCFSGNTTEGGISRRDSKEDQVLAAQIFSTQRSPGRCLGAASAVSEGTESQAGNEGTSLHSGAVASSPHNSGHGSVNLLRLVDGGSPCAGRVEVKHQDQWGTVCSDRWDMTDAGVVCKQLGCGAAVSAPGNAHIGRGSGPIWLKNIACDGTKSALWHCGNEGLGENDCGNGEDAGVTCSGKNQPAQS
ncbi:scavenger receptor cysteine-rich type 1 protein M130-like [Chelonia mydas]|uniref:scavenger receptor cysteine-rich type 1 protein M130-like n=1 Tax=Chelonia mydas TaxID=8469 RepID=UPI001CA84021|nr:scavenger receptor cysteine-rich type 1 protein M130-like [Chelonia mydas]